MTDDPPAPPPMTAFALTSLQSPHNTSANSGQTEKCRHKMITEILTWIQIQKSRLVDWGSVRMATQGPPPQVQAPLRSDFGVHFKTQFPHGMSWSTAGLNPSICRGGLVRRLPCQGGT
jgi:hypothetical protein